MRDRQTPIARILPVTLGGNDDEELHRLAAQGELRLGGSLDDTFWDRPAPRVRREVLKRALEQERDGD